MRVALKLAVVAGAGLAVVLPSVTAVHAVPAVRSSAASGWRVVWRARLVVRNRIIGVVAVGPDDAWAVGETFAPDQPGGYAVHWDGTSWRKVGLPAQFDPDTVLASSPSNVWVSGYQYVVQNGVTNAKPAALRWDGTGWQNMPMPDMSTSVAGLILAVGSSGAWAISDGSWNSLRGWQYSSASWDGTTWTDHPWPSLGAVQAYAASPGGQVWAVGTTSKAQYAGLGRLMAYRWPDAGQWQRVRMPRPETFGVDGVGVASPTSVWLATTSVKLGRHRLHYLEYWHWNGRTLTRLPPSGIASTPIVPDGHGGAWFGPLAHWTGRRWQYPQTSPFYCGVINGYYLSVSHIPRTRSAWGSEPGCGLFSTHEEGIIQLDGPVP